MRPWLAAALLVTIAIGAFWFRFAAPRGRTPAEPALRTSTDALSASAEAPFAPAGRAAVPSTTPSAAGPSPTTSARTVPDGPSRPSPSAAETRAASAAQSRDARKARAVDDLAADLAAVGYEQQGARFVDYLVSRGLSAADAENVIRTALRDGATCSLDAMRAQAEAESVSFDTVLYALDSMLNNGDGPFLRALIDLEAVGRREAPCVWDVLQQAGIPPSVAQELLREPQAP